MEKSVLRKSFLIGMFVLTASPLFADTMPESQVGEQPAAFRSMDEAAVGALRLAASKSMTLEYGGCLVTDGEVFYYTNPETSGSSDEFAVACMIPKSLRLAAIYHTHPLGTPIHGISPNDLRVAKNLDIPSFVASLDLNNVVKFVPGVTRTRCLNEGGSTCSARVSQGDMVESILIERR